MTVQPEEAAGGSAGREPAAPPATGKPRRDAPPAGRPEAAALIWGWRSRGASAPEAAAASRARRHALLQAVVGGAAGTYLYLYQSRPMAYVVLGITAAGVLAAVLSPTGVHAAIQRVMARFARLVGAVVSWLLLAPVFFLVLFPIGLLGRRGRKDSMKRFYEREAATYWAPRKPVDPETRGRPF